MNDQELIAEAHTILLSGESYSQKEWAQLVRDLRNTLVSANRREAALEAVIAKVRSFRFDRYLTRPLKDELTAILAAAPRAALDGVIADAKAEQREADAEIVSEHVYDNRRSDYGDNLIENLGITTAARIRKGGE